MSVTLDQVRCFVALAEELHFGRAARRLQMTQPPFSRQIQRLEQAVGARLVDRRTRGVSLTAAGQAFLHEAYRLLSTLDQAVGQARRVEAGVAGTLHLGFTAVSAVAVLGPLLHRLDGELPGVEVVLHERVSADQAEGLRRGELDLGLARATFDTSLLASHVIVREPLCAVTPTGHRLASITGPLRPVDFEGLPVVGYHPVRARYFHELFVRYLGNVDVRVEQRVTQVLTAILLAAAGRGVALVPATALSLGVEGIIGKELAPVGGERGPEPTDPARPVELHAVWRRDATSPLLREVLQQLDVVRDD